MEEETPCQRSVAELAGRFQGSAAQQDPAGHETEKPVRRRPPHSLQIAKTHGDDPEPPGVTSPLPAKTKRNSALIEKLQANLALSPTALLTSPKSPGFRLLPTAFPPHSPGSAPVTTVTTSSTSTPTSPVATSPLTEEEGPASFEAPPSVGEGSLLSNVNLKGRARHSIKRRPPSRRHRRSSSGDEEGDMSLQGRGEGGGDEEEEGGQVYKDEDQTDGVTEDKGDASMCPEKNKSHEEDEPETRATPRQEDEKERQVGDKSSPERQEEEEERQVGDKSSPERQEEEEDAEKKPSEKQEDLREGAENTESKEDKNEG